MIVCEVTLNAVVAQVAPPATSATLLQIGVAPSLKVTVPLGTPVPGATGATAAVKVTLSPATVGVLLLVTVLALLALLTTCDRAALALPLKLLSPE